MVDLGHVRHDDAEYHIDPPLPSRRLCFPIFPNEGAGTSRSINRGVMWSTLATLGMTTVTSGAGSSAMRMLGASAVSTIAFAFIMPVSSNAIFNIYLSLSLLEIRNGIYQRESMPGSRRYTS